MQKQEKTPGKPTVTSLARTFMVTAAITAAVSVCGLNAATGVARSVQLDPVVISGIVSPALAAGIKAAKLQSIQPTAAINVVLAAKAGGFPIHNRMHEVKVPTLSGLTRTPLGITLATTKAGDISLPLDTLSTGDGAQADATFIVGHEVGHMDWIHAQSKADAARLEQLTPFHQIVAGESYADVRSVINLAKGKPEQLIGLLNRIATQREDDAALRLLTEATMVRAGEQTNPELDPHMTGPALRQAAKMLAGVDTASLSNQQVSNLAMSVALSATEKSARTVDCASVVRAMAKDDTHWTGREQAGQTDKLVYALNTGKLLYVTQLPTEAFTHISPKLAKLASWNASR